MNKKKSNPRTPYKFGFGLLFAGLSFYILSLSGNAADANGMVPFSYLLGLYFLISIGELCMSPVGLSKITDLSPQRIVAFMMGVWFLSSSYAFQLVGFIGKQLAIESNSNTIGGFDSLNIYIDGFEIPLTNGSLQNPVEYFDAKAMTEMKIEMYTDAYRALKFGKVSDLPSSRI